jgi:hypothetical protein
MMSVTSDTKASEVTQPLSQSYSENIPRLHFVATLNKTDIVYIKGLKYHKIPNYYTQTGRPSMKVYPTHLVRLHEASKVL